MFYEGYKCYYEFSDIVDVMNYRLNNVHVYSKEKAAIKKDFKNNVPYKSYNRKAFWEETDIVEYLKKVLPWCNNIDEAFSWYRAESDIKRYAKNDDMKKYYLELEKERVRIITTIINDKCDNKDESFDKLKKIDHIINYITESRIGLNDFYRNCLDAHQRVYFDGGFKGDKIAAFIADHFRTKAIESGMYDEMEEEK